MDTKSLFQWLEASTTNNGTYVDKSYILYFPIIVTETIGLLGMGYELENSNNPQIVFQVQGTENISSIKIQAYRITDTQYEIPYGHFLAISI